MKPKKEDFYRMLLDTGELFDLFEGMTGEWKKDKTKFCDSYDNVMKFLDDNMYLDDYPELE